MWQGIIQRFSLSKKQGGKARGRISYANLGLNQLGSVYESLLAYRGFYAEEDYIEVHKENDQKESHLVLRSRLDEFHPNELLKSANGDLIILKKGVFVYRLSGRDRSKSASYYTPQVLTKSTVRFTLETILEKIKCKELKATALLSIKILEPAMGAAAFINEVVNQIAEAYLEYRQLEIGMPVPPDKYLRQLQIVKAYIATNNTYGVDINPTAIELGKLSIWLNIIHEGMQTPYFAHRIAVGNAVVGAWLKTFSETQLLEGKWWESNPEMVKFKEKTIERKPNHIYHFLLPEKGMVPGCRDKFLKKEFPNEAKHMISWQKEMCRPITRRELQLLNSICDEIDKLLLNHYEFQSKLQKQTQISLEVWSHSNFSKQGKQLKTTESLLDYNKKESLNDQRKAKSSPYYKLKFVLNYWCCLWFWDIRKASHLPNRIHWLTDIQKILDIDEIAFQDKQILITPELKNQNLGFNLRDRLQEVSPKKDLFDNKERIRIVEKISEFHKFFHYQLEFIEVFIERGGFDIIVGNPPWVGVDFVEKDVISELHPELLIRNFSAPEIKKRMSEYLRNRKLKEIYLSEYISTISIKKFLKAYQNYPLLQGNRLNLYKHILTNSFTLVCKSGFIGLLHLETIYDSPRAGELRREMFKRLKYHFQYQNKLKLFSEVHSETIYGMNVYSGNRNPPKFTSMNNVFHPSTIIESFSNKNNSKHIVGKIYDIDAEKFNVDLKGHYNRLLHITENELRLFAKTFEKSDAWESTILPQFHTHDLIKVIEKIGMLKSTLNEYNPHISDCYNQTNAVTDGHIINKNKFPTYEKYELIINGSHLGISNPLYKTPRVNCKSNVDYDTIDLNLITSDFFSRTNYVSISDSYNFFKGFNKDDSWFDYYKIAFRGMLNLKSERTLTGSIFPPKVGHLHALLSVSFKSETNLIEFAGLVSSLVLDFYCRVLGSKQLQKNKLRTFPLGINPKYKNELYKRTLLLNCLNKYYSSLWKNNYIMEFNSNTWSKEDTRLKPFDNLSTTWQWNTPLRNYFERRQALVEIDVIVALAFGLTLEELILVYEIEFSILQKNERNTYYDANGNIVFTTSKSLNGVGVEKSIWGRIKNFEKGETYVHMISKNMLYNGRKITYEAPFERCNRVEDYKRAWGFFKNLFTK